MDRLRAMHLFQRVAELGSYARASHELGVSSSVASSAIKELEAHLGIQLLRRTTRSVKTTEEGSRYLERVRVILSEIDDLEDEIKDAGRKVSGHLRLQVPVGFAHQILSPRLPVFLDSHPQLTIELFARNGLPDFVSDGLDGAVFIGEVPDRDLVARPLGRRSRRRAIWPATASRGLRTTCTLTRRSASGLRQPGPPCPGASCTKASHPRSM